MSKRADPFEWGGGHPALDFVNTLDERPFDRPIENLATYRDLVRFAQLAGLVGVESNWNNLACGLVPDRRGEVATARGYALEYIEQCQDYAIFFFPRFSTLRSISFSRLT